MFKNYIKIAIRIILRNKVYSFITIFGLAISISACLLILQYVSFELSFDRFHTKINDLYRLTNDRYQNGTLIQHGVITYPSVPKAMKAEFPEVLNYARLANFGQVHLRNNFLNSDEDLLFADSAFFCMFSFPLIEGNPQTALSDPFSITLSESSAEKYFGNNWRKKNILGNILNVDNKIDYKITGIFKNLPANTHMHFDFMASYKTLGKAYFKDCEDSWTTSNFYVYLQLVPGTDMKSLERKFTDFSKRHFNGQKVTGSFEHFYLQPVRDIHLYSNYEYEAWPNGNGTAVWALLIIAVLILIIAWVNYINLTTARAAERAHEAGVRKVVGARRWQLVKQFLVESFVYSIAGLALAVVFVELAKTFIAEKMSVNFSSSFFSGNIVLIFIPLFLLGTMITALYPGFIISAFDINKVLKGKLTSSVSGSLLRKSLVVFQFVISFALITGTYAIYSQINFMMNQKLGMNIDQTLVIDGPRLTAWDSTYIGNIESFRAELLRNPGIVNVTSSQRTPGIQMGRIFNIQRKDLGSEKKWTTSELGVDYKYFETFAMPILAGRLFVNSDHNIHFNNIHNIILNQAAAKLFGFGSPEAAINKVINYWGKDWEIVGVVGDHHQQTLRVPIEPVIFLPLYSTNSPFFIKVKTKNLAETISFVKDAYLNYYPGNSFNYFFLDDFFNKQYVSDKRFGLEFGMFALVGVLLACLGLFGLSFYANAQRTKEIGVRKVLGASTGSLVGLLSKNYVKLVLLASVLATPLTYWAVNKWLDGYAYRIQLGWPIFLISLLIILIIALLTVAYQTIRAAIANPVKSLKYE